MVHNHDQEILVMEDLMHLSLVQVEEEVEEEMIEEEELVLMNLIYMKD